MQNQRRTLLAALALAPLLARAQEPRRGSEYTVLAVEQPVEAQGKVEATAAGEAAKSREAFQQEFDRFLDDARRPS